MKEYLDSDTAGLQSEEGSQQKKRKIKKKYVHCDWQFGENTLLLLMLLMMCCCFYRYPSDTEPAISSDDNNSPKKKNYL